LLNSTQYDDIYRWGFHSTENTYFCLLGDDIV
jgi:hypothetical protein